MGEVIALANQVMVPLAAEQLYAVLSRMVTEVLPVMQAWRIDRSPGARSGRHMCPVITKPAREHLPRTSEASTPAHRGFRCVLRFLWSCESKLIPTPASSDATSGAGGAPGGRPAHTRHQ